MLGGAGDNKNANSRDLLWKPTKDSSPDISAPLDPKVAMSEMLRTCRVGYGNGKLQKYEEIK